MKQEILNRLTLGEDHERECKLANGGTILLGIRKHRD